MKGRTWIFHCDPMTVDLPARIASGEVSTGADDAWYAYQRVDGMAPGDRVYHWVSGPESGLHVVSQLTGGPHATEMGWRMDLRYVRVLQPHVPRERVSGSAELHGLALDRIARRSKTRQWAFCQVLSHRQAHALDDLCGMEPLWPFDPAEIARVLRMPLDDPELAAPEVWKARVRRLTAPFFECIEHELAARLPGDPGFKAKRPGKDVVHPWSHDSMSRRVVDDSSLEVRVGQEDRTDGRSDQLFAGLSIWGNERNLAGRLAELRQAETSRRQEPWVFKSRIGGGLNALLGLRLSSDEVERLDPGALLNGVVGELERWCRSMDSIRGGTRGAQSKGSTAGTVLDRLERFVQAEGFRFPRDVLASYYLSLRTKPFVILSGISGTGKTKLAQLVRTS